MKCHISILCILYLCLSGSNIRGQSLDSLYRPAAFIFSLEYNHYEFYGPHVMNQSFDDWSGVSFSIGFTFYNVVDMILSSGRMNSTLINDQYVAFSPGRARIRRVGIRTKILSVGRFTYLKPEIGIGVIKNDLHGEIDGEIFEVANNFSFSIAENFKVVGRISYQQTKYKVETNTDLLPLFEKSQAIIPSIGIQFNTVMTK